MSRYGGDGSGHGYVAIRRRQVEAALVRAFFRFQRPVTMPEVYEMIPETHRVYSVTGQDLAIVGVRIEGRPLTFRPKETSEQTIHVEEPIR